MRLAEAAEHMRPILDMYEREARTHLPGRGRERFEALADALRTLIGQATVIEVIERELRADLAQHAEERAKAQGEVKRWQALYEHACSFAADETHRAEAAEASLSKVEGELDDLDGRIITGLNQQLTEQFDLSTKLAADLYTAQTSLEEAVRVLTEIADGRLTNHQNAHYLAHRNAVNAARSFLLSHRGGNGRQTINDPHCADAQERRSGDEP